MTSTIIIKLFKGIQYMVFTVKKHTVFIDFLNAKQSDDEERCL